MVLADVLASSFPSQFWTSTDDFPEAFLVDGGADTLCGGFRTGASALWRLRRREALGETSQYGPSGLAKMGEIQITYIIVFCIYHMCTYTCITLHSIT